ncbi:MAG: DUF1028 domain-containing protein [Ginsengibacter sp.]
MMPGVKVLLSLLFVFNICYSQNLPSLLLNKNINSTFSILAYDESNKEWGIAVATNNIYVGNSTIYIQPGLGAFSVIAETDPSYADNGFQQLKKGRSIRQAIEFTRLTDTESYNRQVSGIDAKGNVYAFTGAALKYWQGTSTHRLGKNFVVMGNQLADSVLIKMADTYNSSTGTLAERLLKSLIAGQNAGGQITGKQSAALVVKGKNNEWYNQIDLRVDNSKSPFDDLQKLLNYHYGRIRLNQSLYAIKMMNKNRGEDLLHQAEKMLDGWNGIYSKIAMAYLLLGDEQKAVLIIQKALAENPQWKENVPAFYCLYNHSEISKLMNEDSFTVKNWSAAIGLMLEINRNDDAIDLANKVLKKYPSSSFVYYLLGKAYSQSGNKKLAKSNATIAVKLDADNAEAKALLKESGK